MISPRPLHILATSARALLSPGEVTDLLAELVEGAREAMQAQAVGVVVRLESGDLDLLAASSHRAAELELYQAQHHAGPCVDAISTRTAVTASTLDEIESRWPDVGSRIGRAGFTAVHAFPMRWQDTTLGALNVFHASQTMAAEDLSSLGQVYADLVSALLLRPVGLTHEVVHERLGAALSGRILIEQAKGVVAYRDKVDMDVAFDRLRQLAVQQDRSMTSLARQILEAKGAPDSPGS